MADLQKIWPDLQLQRYAVRSSTECALNFSNLPRLREFTQLAHKDIGGEHFIEEVKESLFTVRQTEVDLPSFLETLALAPTDTVVAELVAHGVPPRVDSGV